MENFPLRGLTLIEEDPCISATPLALSTLKRLQNVSYHVVAVALLGEQRELEAVFGKCGLSSIQVISIDISQFEDLIDHLNIQFSVANDKQLVYIPCGDALLRFLGVDKTCRLLYLLSRKYPVLTRLFHDAWTELELARLQSVCTNVLRIYVDNQLCVCETRVDKKDGLVGKTLEQFIVDSSTLAIRSQAYQPPPKYQVNVEETKEEPVKSAQDILPKTTFDMGLNLSEEERRSKAATRLPYTHAQNEQGLVSLNITSGRKVRAGGQIIYTPDANDDLEDSDPDDDLMV